MSSNQTKQTFLRWRVQILHCPVFILLQLTIISTGTVSMKDHNLNFLYSPSALQKKLKCLMWIQDSLLMWQKENMWNWRSPLLLYQTLLCTTVLCSPQWQETHQLSTKTCYSERQERNTETKKKTWRKSCNYNIKCSRYATVWLCNDTFTQGYTLYNYIIHLHYINYIKIV